MPKLILLGLLIGGLWGWFARDTIIDWAVLRNYAPPTEIVQLANDDGMTAPGRSLFYVNKPVVADRAVFNAHCSANSEQSAVLGCFLGDRLGIYIYNVTDSELRGVQQVTAAHEMLHQAYARLDASKRQQVDDWLNDFASRGLQDQSIKDQLALYRKTEPTQINNEMHSLFGTEVENLPQNLKDYYAQYFSDQVKVARYYVQYQSAFNQRKARIMADDASLSRQKAQIDTLEQRLTTQYSALMAQKAHMDALRSAGAIGDYNALVPGFNQQVEQYNQGVVDLQQLISTYNTLVTARNAIALQENSLEQALSSHTLAPVGK